MSIQPLPCYPLLILNLFFILSINVQPIHALISSKKLDKSADGDDPSVKCTPCTRYSPPPPLPPPAPPKKPSPSYCPPPPPPPSSFIYMLGPPGNLYPIDRDFDHGDGRRMVVEFPVVAVFGLIWCIAFW